MEEPVRSVVTTQVPRSRTRSRDSKLPLTQRDVEAKALFLDIYDIAHEPGTPHIFEVHHARHWPLLENGELDRERYDHRSDRLVGIRCWPWIIQIDWDEIEHGSFRHYADYHRWRYDEFETSPGRWAGLINPRSPAEKRFIEEIVQRLWPEAYIRNELNGMSLPGTAYKLDKHRYTARVETGEIGYDVDQVAGDQFEVYERKLTKKERRVAYDSFAQRMMYYQRGGNLEWMRVRLRWFEKVEPWTAEVLAAYRGELPVAPVATPKIVSDNIELPAYVMDIMNRKANILSGRKRSGPSAASKLAWHAVNLALRAGCSEDRIVSLWKAGHSALLFYKTEKQVRADHRRAVRKFGHQSARWRDQDAKYDAIAYASFDPRLTGKFDYRIIVELACFHPDQGDPGPGYRWLRDAVGAASIGTIAAAIDNRLGPIGYAAKTGAIINPRLKKTAQAQTFKVQRPHILPQLPENTTIEHLRDAGWGILKSVCELRERELPRWVDVDGEELVEMVRRLGSVDALYDEIDEDDLTMLIEDERQKAKARKAEALLYYLSLQGEYRDEWVRKLEQKATDLGFGQPWKQAA